MSASGFPVTKVHNPSAGVPEAPWRITVKRTSIDSMVRAVSLRLSPFVRLEAAGEKSTTSTPSERAASAKEVLVRVEERKAFSASHRAHDRYHTRGRGGGEGWGGVEGQRNCFNRTRAGAVKHARAQGKRPAGRGP